MSFYIIEGDVWRDRARKMHSFMKALFSYLEIPGSALFIYLFLLFFRLSTFDFRYWILDTGYSTFDTRRTTQEQQLRVCGPVTVYKILPGQS